jgi:hypothetical protein
MKPATRLVRFNAAPQDPFRPTATPAICYQFATKFANIWARSFGADLWGISPSVLQKLVGIPQQSRGA